VFCRPRLEKQEKVLRVILQKTQSRRQGTECYGAIPPRSSCLQDQHPKLIVKSLVAKGIDLSWVLALPSLVAWPSFCALVAKFVKKCSHGFRAILVGKCHICIHKEVSKVWLQKELIMVGFWLSKVWSHGLVFVPW